MSASPRVEAVFTGVPRQITDQRGVWTSSIFRERATGPVAVSLTGLAGDKVTQPYHGGPGAAVCVHLSDHYAFWNERYGMDLQAGSVGENVTLQNTREDEVCIGDRVRLGSALVQVSAPRVPCANLARRIGREDWVKLTIRENRTGFYLRVLEPGMVGVGDSWALLDRPHPTAAVPAVNRCMYLDFGPAFAQALLAMEGLEEWWKQQLREKLGRNDAHWTSRMQHGPD